jgi:predicted DNA-binding protein (MmcQ/YjbR family)
MSIVAIGARLRATCLALPEANEELMRRGPSYRVADKIFALERPWNDWLALWCKVPDGSREIMLDAEPAHFFIPPYFGAKGWIGVGLDEAANWREIDAFIRRSYRLVAPKRLAKLVA